MCEYEPIDVEGVWTIICDDSEMERKLSLFILKDFKEYQRTGELGDHYTDYIRNVKVSLEPGSLLLTKVDGDGDLYALSPAHQNRHQLRRVNLEQQGLNNEPLVLRTDVTPIRSEHVALEVQREFIMKQWPANGSALSHREDIAHMEALLDRGFLTALRLS